MKITFLTPGTGSYYCGACMRDNVLAKELYRQGEDAAILPMYLPLVLDEEALPGLEDTPIFFGGINIFLQQKIPLFRRAPVWLHRSLNSAGLLRWAARHSHMTSAREHGEMTLEMLDVEASRFRGELDKLIDWLKREEPDVICLSTALQAGMAEELKANLEARIVLFFQGEDTFLDSLAEPYRSRCWERLAQRLSASDALVAPSRYYADFMSERLGLAPGVIRVIANGLHLDSYGKADQGHPQAIGYLARMCRVKGLEQLVDAYIFLKKELDHGETRLKIAGAMTEGDKPLVTQMQDRLARAGLGSSVDWRPNLDHHEKVNFLRSLSVFSVPATYPEAFGLYLIEAMACGVPVVQPRSAAFPEIIEATGGGLCTSPGNTEALARTWHELLQDDARREKIGRMGRANTLEKYEAKVMSEKFLALTRELTGAGSAGTDGST